MRTFLSGKEFTKMKTSWKYFLVFVVILLSLEDMLKLVKLISKRVLWILDRTTTAIGLHQRCKFGPKSLGESEAKRKIYSRGSAKRREAKKFLRSAKKSDKFSLLGEAKKANIFFSKSECFFLIRRKKRKKMLLGEAKKAKTFKKLKRAGKNSRNKAILKILQSG